MSGYSLIASGLLGSNTATLPAQYRPTHSRPCASMSPRRGPEPDVGVGWAVNFSVSVSNKPILPRRYRFMIERPCESVSMSIGVAISSLRNGVMLHLAGFHVQPV